MTAGREGQKRRQMKEKRKMRDKIQTVGEREQTHAIVVYKHMRIKKKDMEKKC